MASISRRLTDKQIKALVRPGLHADGNGLYVNVTKTGTKSWIFRCRHNGRQRDKGLGPYPRISLAEARQQAAALYAAIKRGEDPFSAVVQRSQHVVTFEDAARRYIDAQEKGWKNAKHRQQWRNTIARYCVPVIGAKPVDAITTDDVMRILEPIWGTKPETASRIRGRIETVLDWAAARDLRDGDNPARWRGKLKHLLPAAGRRAVRHHPAMPYDQISAFMAALDANASMSARALELTILTALRTSEALGLCWSEIDRQRGILTVPAERMKGHLGRRLDHKVPLSSRALAVLDRLPRIVGCDFIFPGARQGRQLSNMAMLELLRGMRPGLTVHGFRSTFRDWGAEQTNFPHEVMEMALAHTITNAVVAAYRRGELLDKRKLLMETWAGYCYRKTDTVNIIPLAKLG